MKIVIGSDHRGFNYKHYLMKHLSYEWLDVGCHTDERSDYPVFAKKVASLVQEGVVDSGLLLCGTGIGMSIAANRYPGVYAALVWTVDVARLAKEVDNANVLVLPADFIDAKIALSCTTTWLNSIFKKGRYKDRLDMI